VRIAIDRGCRFLIGLVIALAATAVCVCSTVAADTTAGATPQSLMVVDRNGQRAEVNLVTALEPRWAAALPALLGVLVLLLLLTVLLSEWRAAQTARSFDRLWNTMMTDRQRERDALLHALAVAVARGGDQPRDSGESLEALATRVKARVEQANKEIIELLQRLGPR
jgi:hypothetical protein